MQYIRRDLLRQTKKGFTANATEFFIDPKPKKLDLQGLR